MANETSSLLANIKLIAGIIMAGLVVISTLSGSNMDTKQYVTIDLFNAKLHELAENQRLCRERFDEKFSQLQLDLAHIRADDDTTLKGIRSNDKRISDIVLQIQGIDFRLKTLEK